MSYIAIFTFWSGEPLTLTMRVFSHNEKRNTILYELLENCSSNFYFESDFPVQTENKKQGKLYLKDVVINNPVMRVTENQREPKQNTFCALPLEEELMFIVTAKLKDEESNFAFWQDCIDLYHLMKNSNLLHNYKEKNRKNAEP